VRAAVIENFVRATLHTAISDAGTEIRFIAPALPWRAPADPDGGTAYALLLDDHKAPTRFELVSYTRIEFSRLRGVKRGVNGTTAQAWPVGARITQDLPEELIWPLGLTGSAGEVLRVGASGLEVGAVDWNDVAGKPSTDDSTIFSEIAPPSAPAVGTAQLFLNSLTGAINAQFPGGLRKPIPPSPPVEHSADSKGNSVVFSSVGMTKPDNVVSGDMILAAVVVIGQAGQSWTPPAGFTTIASVGSITESSRCFTWMGYKIAGGSEPSSYSYNIGTFGASSWETRRITGFSSTTPIRSMATADSNPSSVTSLAIGTVTYSDSLAISLLGGGNGTPLNAVNTTEPAGFTSITKSDYTAGFQIGKREYGGSGSTGVLTWSFVSEPSQIMNGINATINNVSIA